MLADWNKGQREHLLTVGMPVYNGAQWLEDSIESILSQSFTDFELFIADNASTDETEEICRDYADHDSRVRYHRHAHNRGALKNYNDVFAMSASKYFKWASCSDLCKPTLFERCIDILEARDEVVLAYAQTALFSSLDGQECLFYQNLTLEEDSANRRFGLALDWLGGLNCAYNGVFRRSALDNMMPYKEVRSYDINMMLEMSLYGKFVEVFEPLFYRRFEPQSTGILLNQANAASFFGTDKTHFGRLQWVMREIDRFAMPFRTPIPLSDKLHIELDLATRMMGRAPAVARDLAKLPIRAWRKIMHLE